MGFLFIIACIFSNLIDANFVGEWEETNLGKLMTGIQPVLLREILVSW